MDLREQIKTYINKFLNHDLDKEEKKQIIENITIAQPEYCYIFLKEICKEEYINRKHFCRKFLELLHMINSGRLNTERLRKLVDKSLDGNDYIKELLQNADDCKYYNLKKDTNDNSVDIYFRIKINKEQRHLLIEYPEDGFKFNNIISLLNIGYSDKNLDDSQETSTGEKGVGFKSLFSKFDTVRIESGYFDFKINRDNYIVPTEINEVDNFKQGTKITLSPLLDEFNKSKDELIKYIENNFGQFLLFLKNLNKIEIYDDEKMIYSIKASGRREKDILEIIHLKENNDYKIEKYYQAYENFVLNEDDTEIIKSRYGDDGIKEYRGYVQVLLPLDCNKKYDSNLYSFFKLDASIDSNLLIHIPVALDTSRKNIYFGLDEDRKNFNCSKWNNKIIKTYLKNCLSKIIDYVFAVEYLILEQYNDRLENALGAFFTLLSKINYSLETSKQGYEDYNIIIRELKKDLYNRILSKKFIRVDNEFVSLDEIILVDNKYYEIENIFNKDIFGECFKEYYGVDKKNVLDNKLNSLLRKYNINRYYEYIKEYDTKEFLKSDKFENVVKNISNSSEYKDIVLKFCEFIDKWDRTLITGVKIFRCSHSLQHLRDTTEYFRVDDIGKLIYIDRNNVEESIYRICEKININKNDKFVFIFLNEEVKDIVKAQVRYKIIEIYNERSLEELIQKIYFEDDNSKDKIEALRRIYIDFIKVNVLKTYDIEKIIDSCNILLNRYLKEKKEIDCNETESPFIEFLIKTGKFYSEEERISISNDTLELNGFKNIIRKYSDTNNNKESLSEDIKSELKYYESFFYDTLYKKQPHILEKTLKETKLGNIGLNNFIPVKCYCKNYSPWIAVSDDFEKISSHYSLFYIDYDFFVKYKEYIEKLFSFRMNLTILTKVSKENYDNDNKIYDEEYIKQCVKIPDVFEFMKYRIFRILYWSEEENGQIDSFSSRKVEDFLKLVIDLKQKMCELNEEHRYIEEINEVINGTNYVLLFRFGNLNKSINLNSDFILNSILNIEDNLNKFVKIGEYISNKNLWGFGDENTILSGIKNKFNNKICEVEINFKAYIENKDKLISCLKYFSNSNIVLKVNIDKVNLISFEEFINENDIKDEYEKFTNYLVDEKKVSKEVITSIKDSYFILDTAKFKDKNNDDIDCIEFNDYIENHILINTIDFNNMDFYMVYRSPKQDIKTTINTVIYFEFKNKGILDDNINKTLIKRLIDEYFRDKSTKKVINIPNSFGNGNYFDTIFDDMLCMDVYNKVKERANFIRCSKNNSEYNDRLIRFLTEDFNFDIVGYGYTCPVCGHKSQVGLNKFTVFNLKECVSLEKMRIVNYPIFCCKNCYELLRCAYDIEVYKYSYNNKMNPKNRYIKLLKNIYIGLNKNNSIQFDNQDLVLSIDYELKTDQQDINSNNINIKLSLVNLLYIVYCNSNMLENLRDI